MMSSARLHHSSTLLYACVGIPVIMYHCVVGREGGREGEGGGGGEKERPTDTDTHTGSQTHLRKTSSG